jgi:RHS repeat-associated protein
VSATDYYPFGWAMPGRTYTAASYKYGFNGKENDNEVKGEGNQQDYGMRIYDPRLGRFLSVDPIGKDYPMLTPYQFASNSPIEGIDKDGKEFLSFQESLIEFKYGCALVKKQYAGKESLVSGDGWIGTTRMIAKYDFNSNIPKASSSYFSDKANPDAGEYHLDGNKDFTPSVNPIFDLRKNLNPHFKKDGTNNKSYTRFNTSSYEIGKNSGFTIPGKGFLVLEVARLGLQAYDNYTADKFADAFNYQKKFIEPSVDAVSKASIKGEIPSYYQNFESINKLTNFVLQGDRTGMSKELINIGINITKELGIYKPKLEGLIFNTSGLDNLKTTILPNYERK